MEINVRSGELYYGAMGDEGVVMRLQADDLHVQNTTRENVQGLDDNDLFNLREIMGFTLTEVENVMEDRKLLGRYTQRDRNA